MSFPTATIYPTRSEAIAVNAAKAEREGCDMVHTTEWWRRINHPTDGRSALIDNMGTTTRQELVEDGWFPEEQHEET